MLMTILFCYMFYFIVTKHATIYTGNRTQYKCENIKNEKE